MNATVTFELTENLLTVELHSPFGPIERMDCLSRIDRITCAFANVLINAGNLSEKSDLQSVKNLLVQLGFRRFGRLGLIGNATNEHMLTAIVNWFPLENPVRVFTCASDANRWLTAANNEES